MEKVYISGPISGYDLKERKAYFKKVSDILVNNGYHPVNPMNNGIPENADIKRHYKADFALLLGCDLIFLCEGWENSIGCQKEATIALWSGIFVLPKSAVMGI